MKIKAMIPNIISLVRLAGIPALLFFMTSHLKLPWWFVSTFFLLLAATDMLDGFLARKLHAESDLGALLDPLIDKLLVLCPLIVLVGSRAPETNHMMVPAWMVIALLARELWITGLRGMAATKGIVIQAAEMGKLKTFLQVVAVALLLVDDRVLFELFESEITAHYAGLQSLLGAIILAYMSGFEYTVQFFQRITRSQSSVVSNTQIPSTQTLTTQMSVPQDLGDEKRPRSFLLGRRA